MGAEKIDLAEKLALFNDHWQPRIVGELNAQHVKLAKILGEFIWHKHGADLIDTSSWLVEKNCVRSLPLWGTRVDSRVYRREGSSYSAVFDFSNSFQDSCQRGRKPAKRASHPLDVPARGG